MPIKLSISNIAWDTEYNETVYALMKQYAYTGLEIAPTKIFPDIPYEKLKDAKKWAKNLKRQYGIVISSMQSIWYGQKENMFKTERERDILLSYTKDAINFAQQIGCRNLVFGCPRNRNMPNGADAETAIVFFRELGNYALEHNTVLAMEANPPIYNTNYVNDTKSALELIKQVNSKGFKLNLDVGTMIHNSENLDLLEKNIARINHVHISEPGLGNIVRRDLHRELFMLLKRKKYKGFVSIEMNLQEDLKKIEKAMCYVSYLAKEQNTNDLRKTSWCSEI